MLLSIALIFALGIFAGWCCTKIKVPALFGMIITGIVIGPHILNLIDPSIMNISSQLRRIALIIILIRAGLSLSIEDLKKVGRPAILMCFLPACCEIAGMVLLAPRLLGISMIDALIMGTVIAAVSPAVIVPKMIRLIEEGRGTDKAIPQLILAGASVDDVFVIVMFSVFTGFAQGEDISAAQLINIPVSIAVGIVVGICVGIITAKIFERLEIRHTVKIIMLLCISFIMVTIEDKLPLPFASLIAVMCMGIAVKMKKQTLASDMAKTYNKLWIGAEVMLFVLVGATIDPAYVKTAGAAAGILILAVLVFRMAGVLLCLIKTDLNIKERIFCMLAYTPKATVQAAIGGIPLSMGLECGDIVLTVAVMAILITAPLGAFAIDITNGKFLRGENI